MSLTLSRTKGVAVLLMPIDTNDLIFDFPETVAKKKSNFSRSINRSFSFFGKRQLDICNCEVDPSSLEFV